MRKIGKIPESQNMSRKGAMELLRTHSERLKTRDAPKIEVFVGP